MTISQEETLRRKKKQDVVMLNDEELIPELHNAEKEQLHTDIWYLDNRVSNHKTGHHAKFQRLDESITGALKFGDGSIVEIMGKGSILLQCKNSHHRVLPEEYYIPRLRSNIISLDQMTEDGNEVEIVGEFLKAYDGNGTLLMSVRRSSIRLYKIQQEACKPTCLMASFDNPAWLWHARLEHINFHALKLMGEKQMALRLPVITHPNKVCEGCLVAKQAKSPFPAQENFRTKEPLELLHVDMCGPVIPCTVAGNKYFFLIVDDCTHWMWYIS